jgi:hypothetical protein
MPCRSQFQSTIGGDRGLDAIHQDREPRTRLQHVDLGGGANSSIEILGTATEGVGQSEKDSADFLCFLLFEGDDVVVDFDRAERFEKQAGAAARAAVDDPGDRRSMLGPDDEDVPPIPIGDDLLLQVLRGVLASKIRFQGAAKPCPLLAKPFPQALQLWARIIEHFAGGIDLPADVCDLVFKR